MPRALFLAAALLLALTGCTPGVSTAPVDPPTGVAAVIEPVTEAPPDPNSPPGDLSVAGGVERTSRGNIPLAYNQPFTSGGTTMRIIGATFDAPCSSGGRFFPATGHYLALLVTASLEADATETPFSPLGWSWIDADGRQQGLLPATPDALSCTDPAQRMPSTPTSGDEVAWEIVLEVSSVGGVLVYQSDTVGPGHEWSLST